MAAASGLGLAVGTGELKTPPPPPPNPGPEAMHGKGEQGGAGWRRVTERKMMMDSKRHPRLGAILCLPT